MKVKMLVSINGSRNGQPYPPAGDIMDLVDYDDGHDLLDNNYAELVEDEIEAAVDGAPENAAVFTAPPVPRIKLRKK